MTQDQETILMIRGAIAEMPAPIQDQVAAILNSFDVMRKEFSEEALTLAVAYYGAKLQAES